MIAARPPGRRNSPSLRSTVTPAKLATFCRLPVNRLKSAVLPQLGLPSRAMRAAAAMLVCTPAPPEGALFVPWDGPAALTSVASYRIGRVDGHLHLLRLEPAQRE